MAVFVHYKMLFFILILLSTSSWAQVSETGATIDASSSLDTLANVATTTASVAVQKITQGAASFGPIGRIVLMVLRFIPVALYWLISFATITLPTWIFTVLSMSLTFTMNMTTL